MTSHSEVISSIEFKTGSSLSFNFMVCVTEILFEFSSVNTHTTSYVPSSSKVITSEVVAVNVFEQASVVVGYSSVNVQLATIVSSIGTVGGNKVQSSHTSPIPLSFESS